jgi:DNA-binding response OmpR family regulator
VQKLLDAGMSWDLVISDYQFEDDLTGLDIIKMVRQFSGRKTPCILISGDTSASILNMAKVAGHHLLHKPVKPAKLRSLVQFLCS